MVLVVVVAVVVVYLFIYLSVFLQAWRRSYSARLPEFLNLTSKNETMTMLRDFLIFRSWQHQKRSNSARLPSKMESWVQSWRPCTNAFCDFSTPPDSTCLKYRACHEKSEARSYEVLHPSRKIIFPKLKIWCSKMQPLSGNQRPDLLTSLMNMSLAPRLRRKMHLCRSSA